MPSGKRLSTTHQASAASQAQGQDQTVSRKRGRPSRLAVDSLRQGRAPSPIEKENVSEPSQQTSSSSAQKRKREGKGWKYEESPSHTIYGNTVYGTRTRSGQTHNQHPAAADQSGSSLQASRSSSLHHLQESTQLLDVTHGNVKKRTRYLIPTVPAGSVTAPLNANNPLDEEDAPGTAPLDANAVPGTASLGAAPLGAEAAAHDEEDAPLDANAVPGTASLGAAPLGAEAVAHNGEDAPLDPNAVQRAVSLGAEDALLAAPLGARFEANLAPATPPPRAPAEHLPRPELEAIREATERAVNHGRVMPPQAPQAPPPTNPSRPSFVRPPPPLPEAKPQNLLDDEYQQNGGNVQDDFVIDRNEILQPQGHIDQIVPVRESDEKAVERMRRKKTNFFEEVQFEPSSCIEFKSPLEVEGLAHLKMQNILAVPIAFKITTKTGNNRIRVFPESGYIDPKSSAFIQIRRRRFLGKEENISLDALIVRWIDADGHQGHVTFDELKESDSIIRSRKFRVFYG